MSAWDNLSIREKADIMKVAISNGITNLNDIRQQYNEFAEGGDTNPPIITTGSTGGHTPAIDTSSLLKSVRTRLYNTINPLSSYYIPEAVENFVSGEPFEYDYLTPYKEIVDDIWAEYLNIPKDQRRFKTRLEQSAYRPGMKKNSNLNYYKLPLTDYDKDKLVEETNYLPVGKNIISDYLAKYNLGDHTIGRGFDNKGEYISYYDRWDLNPFNGKYDGLNIPIINSFSDTSMGIGHPIEIYDRIYLDDYYGMPKNAQKSLYLPEVTIGTRKDDTSEGIQVPYRSYAKGGNLFANGGIHIKPSHRGRLTKLKARTGKTEAELYNDGNPAHKKMVVFARNARKWHDLGGTLFPDGGNMNPSIGKAMQYFMNKGLTDYQAAGLVGNLMRESSLDHRAENKSSKAYGLAQWLGDRKTNLFKKYGNSPTFEQQLDYMWDELNSTHKNGLKMLKASKSAEEAARNAMGYYEFSAGPEKAIANMIKHGQDGESSMRKGVDFAMGIIGQKPAEYVPQMQLPPNYNVLQNWELPAPQYTLDELTASGTMMPAKELPLTTRIPSSVERPNALLDLLAQYQYLDSLLSQ